MKPRRAGRRRKSDGVVTMDKGIGSGIGFHGTDRCPTVGCGGFAFFFPKKRDITGRVKH